MNIRKAVNFSQYLMFISIFIIIAALIFSTKITRQLFELQNQIVTVTDGVNDVLRLKSALLFERDYNVLNVASGHFSELKSNINKLQTGVAGLQIESKELPQMAFLLGDFQNKFEQLTTLQIAYGLSENEGLRGKFRNAAHALQNTFTQKSHEPLLILKLEIRRREKDFLLRGDEIYLKNHADLVSQLRNEIIKAQFSPSETIYLNELLSNYHTSFTEIANNLEQQGFHNGKGLRLALTQIESSISTLQRQLSQSLMDKIRTYFLWFFSTVVLSVVVLISLSAFWLMKVNTRIFKGIKKITETMQRITGESNFGLRFQHSEEDEFKLMCEDLNKLLTHFEKVLKNLEEAQDRMIQSEKLASLVGMVSGVAHELNTPLGVSITSGSIIKEQIQEIKQSFADKNLSKNRLEQILKDSEASIALLENNLARTNHLITQFKEITAYQNYSEQVEFSLFTIVESVIVGLNQEITKVDTTIDIDIPESWLFHCYAGAFGQIIQLLLVNALRHAVIPEKTLHIKISAKLDDTENLTLSVADNGKGVPQEDMAKIFEPFFTTSRKNGGTGLGLSVVFNLVEQKLGGKVQAKHNTPNGLIIELTVPNMKLYQK